MLHTETYSQALKAPTARGGRGWAHADAASMQAARAEALGMLHCLNADAIYDWANRHDICLRDERKRLQTPDLLLITVLNDWPLERAERELGEA